MSTEVVMPQMGESLSEGTITKWYKKTGDHVERDEPLFEITTDKVDTEVPAPEAGVVQQILVGEGETVSVGTVVALIGVEGSPVTESLAPAPPAPSSPAPGGGHFRSTHEPQTFERRTSSRPLASPNADPSAPPTGDRSHVLSPAVVSLAALHQLPNSELMSIPGTGRGGRITKGDVLKHVSGRNLERPKAPAPSSAAPPERSPAAPMEAREVPVLPEVSPTPGVVTGSTSTSGPHPLSPPPSQYLYQPGPEDRLVPMSQLRRQIAEHMLWSQQISAQVTSFTECDMHRIVGYRDAQKERFEQNEGLPLTFLPFVAEAAVRALKEFPIFNASVVGDQIAFKKHVHLGVAVALEEGLIVPVVRNADEMNFVGLARSIHELADRARGGRLRVEDVQGASFTITNPGMFGGLMGTPMISQPQVAILGLGAVQKKPVVIDDAIAIRPVMVLALSFDHRVIDGATGFQFIEKIRSALERFEI